MPTELITGVLPADQPQDLKPFAARLELRTPVIPGRWLMLDGLLCALADSATPPLAKAGSVYQCSVALFEDVVAVDEIPFIKALRASHDFQPGDFALNPRTGRLPTLDLARRRNFGNQIDHYAAVAARGIWWFGVGDIASIAKLMRDVDAVGKKRSHGFGQVCDFEIEVGGNPQAGLVDAGGYPLRPIPVDEWTGRDDTTTAEEAVEMPYWQGARAICVVPDTPFRSYRELEGMLV